MAGGWVAGGVLDAPVTRRALEAPLPDVEADMAAEPERVTTPPPLAPKVEVYG